MSNFAKLFLIAAVLVGSFALVSNSEAEAGYGFVGYGHYYQPYVYTYPVYRPYYPVYYGYGYGYGCYGW